MRWRPLLAQYNVCMQCASNQTNRQLDKYVSDGRILWRARFLGLSASWPKSAPSLTPLSVSRERSESKRNLRRVRIDYKGFLRVRFLGLEANWPKYAPSLTPLSVSIASTILLWLLLGQAQHQPSRPGQSAKL